ncbi:Os01g0159500 [Oryza sativa Japonica Group]|uniref:Os01g0159500 protein n=2 Tax=Oryza sativa subsp. japonica TaxID=39947 RepID=A0A8J8Y3D9_ORYSJ|nr:hypothetical protein OsJ_00463 [Oryza sativa Japonica Group]BAB08204.1 unnamed protein product [Oryza sativa Japonica Group]BAF03999.1 Os01g0159500 [Oryza sativa Japonica Group]BAG91421.1 unnamed protein product [Oryza sativa Japonica Group]|eukprot:NP_001042085.1 Os01g0159500 [Oryza sativa Japonica Group]
MGKAASMRVALVSVVLVGLILVSTAHAARPEKLPAVVSPSIAPAVAEVVDAAINAVDLLAGFQKPPGARLPPPGGTAVTGGNRGNRAKPRQIYKSKFEFKNSGKPRGLTR